MPSSRREPPHRPPGIWDDDGDGQNENENADRGADADELLPEGGHKHEERQHLGRDPRSTERHHPHEVEYFEEDQDQHRDHDHHEVADIGYSHIANGLYVVTL